MQNPNKSVASLATAIEPSDPTEPVEAADPARPTWHAEVGMLMSRAAALCIDHGLDVDAYMNGAWTAYVEARPGMRDHLEELQLRDQLEELRRMGRLGSA